MNKNQKSKNKKMANRYTGFHRHFCCCRYVLGLAKHKVNSPYLKGFLLGITISLCFLSISFLFAWTEPSSNPPNENVASPLNVGSVSQTKQGDLILPNLSLNATGNEGDIINADQIIGYNDLRLCGNPTSCSTETSDADIWIDSNGNVKIQTGNLEISNQICLGGECKGSWGEIGNNIVASQPIVERHTGNKEIIYNGSILLKPDDELVARVYEAGGSVYFGKPSIDDFFDSSTSKTHYESISNESNIYDHDDGTAASFGFTLKVSGWSWISESKDIILWDFGESSSKILYIYHGGFYSGSTGASNMCGKSEILGSNDKINWETLTSSSRCLYDYYSPAKVVILTSYRYLL